MPNPYHEPAGSEKGGQFAKGKGNSTMNKMIRKGAGVVSSLVVDKDVELYHSTNGNNVVISSAKERLIPNSASLSNKHNSTYGKNEVTATLKKGTKVLVIDGNENFYDFGLEEDTPMNRGAAIYEYAVKHGFKVVRLEHVFGVRGFEYAVLDLSVLR
jgi:predicted amino acid dehydrogenase